MKSKLVLPVAVPIRPTESSMRRTYAKRPASQGSPDRLIVSRPRSQFLSEVEEFTESQLHIS